MFIGLVILTLGGLIYYGPDLMSRSGSGVIERVEEPTVAEAPEAVKEETTTTQETTTEETTTEASEEEEEPAPTAPSDPTMYLSVPKLGVFDAVVADGDAGLEIGAMHMPGTGFPWQSGANTYIAGHRLGFPGTGSDHIFYNLPSLGPGDSVSLRDSNGHTYNYQVSEMLQVLPTDLSVLNSVGDDVVSLQTCIENFGDFATLGPDWNVRLIARAVRV